MLPYQPASPPAGFGRFSMHHVQDEVARVIGCRHPLADVLLFLFIAFSAPPRSPPLRRTDLILVKSWRGAAQMGPCRCADAAISSPRVLGSAW